MKKLHRGRLLLSTCLTGIALASAAGAQAQDTDPNWQPRAEVDARASDGSSQVSFELFAPVAQNDSNLLFVSGRIGYDEHFDRNGSVTIGGRGKIGDDFAIGVNAGVDFYKSNLSKRDQTAVSFGLEGFTSVFDVRLNYRLPVTNRYTIGYLDPNASPVGALLVENNRLIERKSGWRLEDVPLGGANAEIGATIPVGRKLSVRASAAGFDYRDDAASKAYRGVRGALELGVEDPLGTGGRFTIGAELQNDNRWGTQARGTVRLSIPFGGRGRDRGAGTSGLDRQMGDRIRRDYVTPSGTRYTDLTSNSFAIDARTGNEFGGIYYVNGAAAAAGAGTSSSPTTLADAVTRAGANGVVVAMGNAGNITTGGVTLATNQYLVGGASSVSVRHSNGTVSAFSFGSSNGTVVGSNAGGAAVTLGQGSVVRDLTVRGAGAGILANGVGGFSLDRVTIENTGGAGLTLTNTTGTVVVDGITIRGGAGAGLLVNGGSGLVVRNSTIGGGAGAIDINDAGGNLTASLSNLTLTATGGTVLDIDGSGAGTVQIAGLSGIFIAGGYGETGGFAARNVTFDSSTATGIQAVNAGSMQVGSTTARVNGAGVSLTEVDGALSFASLNIANNAGTGLTVNNTKAGTFTLTSTTGTVDTTAGTALNLDPLLINLNFAAVSSTGAAGAGIILDNVQGAGTGGSALNIGTLTIANSGQQGLLITGGSTGLVTIGGGTITNSGGASVQIGEAGVAGSGGTIGLNLGATITDSGPGPLVSLFNTGGAIRFTGAVSGTGPIAIDGTAAGSSIVFAGNVAINGATGPALSINNVAGTVGFTGTVTITNPTGSGILIGNSAAGSTVAFTGATTITGAGAPALSLNNLAGATAFTGALSIINPAGTAIVIGAVPGGVTFGDVDITGLGAATGLDLTGTSGNVTFATLDITGTGAAGSTGIDLTNAANAGAVTIVNPSVIQGVDIGANLTNAHITGSFRYGDGNAADGLESRITANTVILVAGMNATQGTYDFADVQLDGNTNNITGGSFTTYYVLAGATGTGTALDPGSIAGAAASGAQYIVLLNNPNGGQDVIDTGGLAGGGLSLTAGQSLVSFLNTDFFAVTGATVPANLIVSNLGPTGIVNTFAGSGAAILTSSLGGSTVNLANDTRIDGVIINNDAFGIGVVGSGVSNVIVRNSTISGTGGAISITDGGAATSVTLANLNLSASGGTVLNLNGTGAGTVNVSGTGINIAATGTGQGLAINDVTVGTLDVASVTTGTAAGDLAEVDGSVGRGGRAGGDTTEIKGGDREPLCRKRRASGRRGHGGASPRKINRAAATANEGRQRGGARREVESCE
ncbi:beta strand repeat-containing protein, partial [Sphingomonas koreensis]|uniref:beta strand repeat-containing protein n=1 Tax=Sphingomonas koreensis TaxID=93064 RepID=UPI001001343D